jgi:hypothetical protein
MPPAPAMAPDTDTGSGDSTRATPAKS